MPPRPSAASELVQRGSATRRAVRARTLAALGLTEEEATLLRDMLRPRTGLVVVAGPSGAGKSTMLDVLATVRVGEGGRVPWLFDPLARDGVGRAVDAARPHMTIASVEARDRDGVFAFLGAGAPVRSVAEVLVGVVVQRLAHRLCERCAVRYVPTRDELARLGLSGLPRGSSFARAPRRPCEACGRTGYSGRALVVELAARPRAIGGDTAHRPMGLSVMARLLAGDIDSEQVTRRRRT